MAAVQVQLDGRGEQVRGGVLLPGSRSGAVLLPQGLAASEEEPVRVDGGKLQQKFLDKVKSGLVASRQDVGVMSANWAGLSCSSSKNCCKRRFIIVNLNFYKCT